eukprot:6646314-Prymnesium_polylepis.1
MAPRPASAKGATGARPGYLTRPPSSAKLGLGGGASDANPADAQQRGADPKQIAATLHARGNAAHERGDLLAAVGLYKRAISLDSSNAAYYSARALAFRKLNRWNEAIADYSIARRIEQRSERPS